MDDLKISSDERRMKVRSFSNLVLKVWGTLLIEGHTSKKKNLRIMGLVEGI